MTDLRLAAFLRGIDGLCLPEVAGVEVLQLVRRGAPEEAWARRFLPDDRILGFTIDGPDPGPYPSTETLLARSDVHRLLRDRGATALLMSASCTPATRAWAQRHGVRLLMTDYDEQRRLEDKLRFDAFLRRHALPCPRGGAVTLGRRFRLPVAGRAVIQAPDSMGGEGTYFVDGAPGVAALLRAGVLARGGRYLARAHIHGRPFGITVFVAPGRVALSAVRLQCYHPREDGAASRAFAGVQWIPTASLAPRLRRRIDATFLEIGSLLHRRRFFGFANLDFMVDARDRVFVIECNPRMSAATPQLLRHDRLAGLPAGEIFLRGFIGPRVYPRAFTASPMPESAFRGATLDLVPPPGVPRVQRSHASGVYALGAPDVPYRGPDARALDFPDAITLFSFAGEGQPCAADDTLATILSNAPLYDDQGDMLPDARRLLDRFRYTDDPRP